MYYKSSEFNRRYQKELRKVKESEEYKTDQSRFRSLMKDLEVLAGRKFNDVEGVYFLFLTLAAEQAMDLELPEWTKEYFPKGPILDAALFNYKMYSYNENLIKMNGGIYMRKILDNILRDVRDNQTERKIFLYSGHEFNIAGILIALNLWNNTSPEYSSAIIFELHENNSVFELKVRFDLQFKISSNIIIIWLMNLLTCRYSIIKGFQKNTKN